MSGTIVFVGLLVGFTKSFASNSATDGLGKINLLPCFPSTEANCRESHSNSGSKTAYLKNGLVKKQQ
jgi:hypothetical protein